MKLLTQQDLAERWQVSVGAIEKWRREGVLQPAKGIPAIRFTPEYVAQLEGIELKKTSPFYVRKLEQEMGALQEENGELKGIIARILAETSKVINL